MERKIAESKLRTKKLEEEETEEEETIYSKAENAYFHVSMVHDGWLNLQTREMWIHSVDTDPSFTDGEEPGVEYNMATKVIKNLYLLKNQRL